MNEERYLNKKRILNQNKTLPYTKVKDNYPDEGIEKKLIIVKDTKDEQICQIYECPICLNLLWNAVECKNDECQNSFCESCVKKLLLKGENKCPICQISPFLYRNSINIKKGLSVISLKCIFEGCNETPNYSNYIEHLEKCPFSLYKCNNEGCNFEGIKKDIEIHINECPFKIIECELCFKKIKFNQKEKHLKEDCEEASIECPLCKISMKKKIYKKEHFSENNENLDCLKKQLLNYKNNLFKLKITIDNKDNICNLLKKSNDDLKKENDILKQSLTFRENEIQKLKNNIFEKCICTVKVDKFEDNGILCSISKSILIVNMKNLKRENFDIGKEITLYFNKDETYLKLKIDECRKICTFEKINNEELNIIIMELKPNEDKIYNKIFLDREYINYASKYLTLDDKLLNNLINEYNNISEIFLTLNIEEKDINQKIYYLDNTEGEIYDNEKNTTHYHDNLDELNDGNTEVYINNKKEKIFEKFFIPKEKTTYYINIKIKIKLTNCKFMFYGCDNLTKIDLSSFNSEKVTNMRSMFYGCSNLTNINLSSLNTQNVVDMSGMFYKCNNLKDINLSSFNTQNVMNMRAMFYRCDNLKDINLTNFNTENVMNMRTMFYGCSNLVNINLSSFNTQNVMNMSSMFNECYNLSTINLSSFNTEKLTNMKFLFCGCNNLTNIDLSSFKTDNVTNMEGLFCKCNNLLNINLLNFNTQKVINMKQMFLGCKKLTYLDLSNFNTKNVMNMKYMFSECDNLWKINLSSFKIQEATDIENIFYKSDYLQEIEISDHSSNKIKKKVSLSVKLIIK